MLEIAAAATSTTTLLHRRLAICRQLIDMALQAIAPCAAAVLSGTVFVHVRGADPAKTTLTAAVAAVALMHSFPVSGALLVAGRQRNASQHQQQRQNGFVHFESSAFDVQPGEKMVGGTGIEPVTPTMST
jgi:hypothetical protein